MLYGREAMERLKKCRVALFGLGGVGGYVMEALVRSGIGAIDVIDHDTVDETNLNRQILATRETIGKEKTEAAKERALSIRPDCVVRTYPVFYLPETADRFDFRSYDYVIDAVDTVTAKIAIIERAVSSGTPVISCMGTGNKENPAMLTVSDISKTTVCPLARVMRRELKKRGIIHVKTVFSKEIPMKPETVGNGPISGAEPMRRAVPGSTPFVPGAAGLLIASEVVKDLLGRGDEA